MTRPIPDGFHSLTPHIIVKDCGAAIDWYKKAFGAEEVMRLPAPDGSVIHAEVRIGNSIMMLAPENPDWKSRTPNSIGDTPVSLHLYVDDVDAFYKQAVAAGARGVQEPRDMFWGDRYGKVVDPDGHYWGIATHVADPAPEDMEKAMKEMFAQKQG